MKWTCLDPFSEHAAEIVRLGELNQSMAVLLTPGSDGKSKLDEFPSTRCAVRYGCETEMVSTLRVPRAMHGRRRVFEDLEPRAGAVRNYLSQVDRMRYRVVRVAPTERPVAKHWADGRPENCRPSAACLFKILNENPDVRNWVQFAHAVKTPKLRLGRHAP